MKGGEGATFSIFWGEVSADSDGPVEWCKPVPESGAKALVSHYPELTLRAEPAHREAYVAIPNDAFTDWPGREPRRAMAARVRLCVPGRRRAVSTPKRLPSSPRILECESPTS